MHPPSLTVVPQAGMYNMSDVTYRLFADASGLVPQHWFAFKLLVASALLVILLRLVQIYLQYGKVVVSAGVETDSANQVAGNSVRPTVTHRSVATSLVSQKRKRSRGRDNIGKLRRPTPSRSTQVQQHEGKHGPINISIQNWSGQPYIPSLPIQDPTTPDIGTDEVPTSIAARPVPSSKTATAFPATTDDRRELAGGDERRGAGFVRVKCAPNQAKASDSQSGTTRATLFEDIVTLNQELRNAAT